VTAGPPAYESAWGWLVASDPVSRARVHAALGPPADPRPVGLAAATKALPDADASTVLALDAWLAGSRYPASPRPAVTRLPFDYRHIPPAMRGALLGLVERLRGSATAGFPEWPTEPRLDLARERVWAVAAATAGVALHPPQWPAGRVAAVLLTHDIDVVRDLARIDALRDLERDHGLVSAFGFVPRVSWPDRGLVERLAADGCESYVHDYGHDGRFPYAGRDRIEAAFAGLFAHDPWARPLFRGFRSGQLLMTADLLAAVGAWFDYDLSIPDVERGGPYGAVAGAGTVVPFLTGPLVELPLTMPQDFFLEQVLRLGADRIASLWRAKLEWVISRGGVVTLNTHPLWANPDRPAMWQAYGRLVRAVADDARLWVTTPSSVSTYLRGLRAGSGTPSRTVGARAATSSASEPK
jgi:hypothetical protein